MCLWTEVTNMGIISNLGGWRAGVRDFIPPLTRCFAANAKQSCAGIALAILPSTPLAATSYKCIRTPGSQGVRTEIGFQGERLMAEPGRHVILSKSRPPQLTGSGSRATGSRAVTVNAPWRLKRHNSLGDALINLPRILRKTKLKTTVSLYSSIFKARGTFINKSSAKRAHWMAATCN